MNEDIKGTQISKAAQRIHKELDLPTNSIAAAAATILAAIEYDELPAVTMRVHTDAEMKVEIAKLLGRDSPELALNVALVALLHFSMYDLGEGNDAPNPERIANLAAALRHGGAILSEGFAHARKVSEAEASGN